MKRVFAVFMAIIMMLTPVLANEFTDTMLINGEQYVPVRAFAEANGWQVDWDGEGRRVILTDPSGGSHSFPEIIGENVDGRIFIPIAFAELIFNGGGIGHVWLDSLDIHGMLTQITHGENVAYIIGSMHAGQPNWFPLHPAVEDVMGKADIFVFEVDMSELLNITDELMAEIEAVQLLPDGMTLEDILSEEDFAQFMENFETFAIIGLTYDLIESFKPISLFMAIETIMMTILGVDLNLSVDSYVTGFALENEKPVIGLNSIMNEFEIIYNVPIEEQALMLVDFADFETMLEVYSDIGLITMYAAQDIEGISEMFLFINEHREEGSAADQFNTNLMYKRDHIFANEIARLLQETDEPTVFFITVGLAHIVPGYGLVLDLLEEMGFEITSLWYDLPR